MKLVFLVVSVLSWPAACIGQEANFRFVVSGELSSKLDQVENLLFWSPHTRKVLATKFDGKGVALPFELFQDKLWVVEFSDARGLLFSLELSPELFDKSRTINAPLNKPNPHILPTFRFRRRSIRYHAGITKRIHYRDLPFWDKDKKKFGKSKAPTFVVTQVTDNSILQTIAMESGCMGFKWDAAIDRKIRIANKTKLQFSVTYDSGGLFDEIKTTYDFTYQTSLHGK